MKALIVLGSTHRALLAIEQLKLRNVTEKLATVEEDNFDLRETIKAIRATVKEVSKTNAKLSQELLILRGVVKAPTERTPDKSPDPYLQPDIVAVEETDNESRFKAGVGDIKKAREEFEKQLEELAAEVNVEGITPEAMEEALVTSPEQWKEQHREPDQE